MLQKLGFLPGFNKQVTSTGAESQWIDGENVRFRYGTPEKIGGWSQLGFNKLTGVTRGLHHMVNKNSIKYAILGTNRILYAYSGGVYYDIHPIKTDYGADFGAFTINFASGSPTVSITFPGTTSTTGIEPGDILLMSDFTGGAGTGFSSINFDGITFMVTSVVSATELTITMGSNATATTTGTLKIKYYYPVGPAEQLGSFGYGISLWGGTFPGTQTTTLVGTLADDAYGTGGNPSTEITVTSVLGFPSTGVNYFQIGTEEISYTGVDTTTNKFTGIVRGVRNSTRTSHLAGATITSTSKWTGWGSAASSTDSVAPPGLWSLDNFGNKLIALIVGGPCFEWDSDSTTATSTRATRISGTPFASNSMLVSTTDRHLLFLGTQSILPFTENLSTNPIDPMLIRFSSQENISDYTPTATNTAGSQRLAAGSKIVGAKVGRSAIYVWTDTSLFTMRFVGDPFTFAFEQVGTNCGLIGMNAAVEVDGAAYWMSENGFFRYTGKLESMDCLVEDYVYDNINLTSNQLIYCGINNLFGEITWFYPTADSNNVNRAVTYSYLDSTAKRPIWSTNDSTLFARTTWQDSSVFGLPHGTQYTAGDDASYDVVGNTEGSTIYFEHEIGVNQTTSTGISAIPTSIISGDYDITQKVIRGAATNMADLRGDGEFIMRISRIIPDFISQQGNSIIQLDLRNYPNDTAASSSLGPFTITSTTDKVDTRARGRAIALTISNTAVDTSWKLGTFRLDIHAGGRR